MQILCVRPRQMDSHSLDKWTPIRLHVPEDNFTEPQRIDLQAFRSRIIIIGLDKVLTYQYLLATIGLPVKWFNEFEHFRHFRHPWNFRHFRLNEILLISSKISQRSCVEYADDIPPNHSIQ